jgi:hypothetical protein
MKISDYVLALLGPMPESSLPKDEWELGFLEEATRSLVKEKGEVWIGENREFLLAQLRFIWRL